MTAVTHLWVEFHNVDSLSFVQRAMSVMGLNNNAENEVLSLVAAVLHLGNISFREKGNYAEVADKQCQSSF